MDQFESRRLLAICEDLLIEVWPVPGMAGLSYRLVDVATGSMVTGHGDVEAVLEERVGVAEWNWTPSFLEPILHG